MLGKRAGNRDMSDKSVPQTRRMEASRRTVVSYSLRLLPRRVLHVSPDHSKPDAPPGGRRYLDRHRGLAADFRQRPRLSARHMP